MAAAVAAEGRPQLRLETGDPATVTVALPKHRTGGLAAAAGVLALHSLVVHAAAVLSADVACPAVTVLRFTVTPRFGGFPDPALLRSNLARVLDGSLALDEALARKERDYAPAAASGEPAAPARVLWFDDEATGAVVMELRGTDRIGLLHRVAAALARATSACGGRGSPRSGRRWWTRSAWTPTTARSGSHSGAWWSGRCSPRRGSPTGTERANRTLARCASRSSRAARPEPAARGGHARRGQVHAARPPARPSRCRGPRFRRTARRAAAGVRGRALPELPAARARVAPARGAGGGVLGGADGGGAPARHRSPHPGRGRAPGAHERSRGVPVVAARRSRRRPRGAAGPRPRGGGRFLQRARKPRAGDDGRAARRAAAGLRRGHGARPAGRGARGVPHHRRRYQRR